MTDVEFLPFTRPGQVRIRSLMIAILAVAGFCAVARWDAYTAVMTTFFLADLLILAWIAGRGRGVVGLVLIAALVKLGLVASWTALRDGLQTLGLIASRSKVFDEPGSLRKWLRYCFEDVPHWKRLCAWEAWSLARWTIVFGLLTWSLALRSRGRLKGADAGADAARSLLRFTPWLIVMELGGLLGVWIARGSFDVVPEPSTVFAVFSNMPAGLLVPGYLQFWVLRMGLPTVIVGLAYFRTVARWDWRWSGMGAVLLIPVAILVSIFWPCLYLLLGEYGVVP